MCYLVAKRFDRAGSVALKTHHGNGLVNFTKEVDKKIVGKEIFISGLNSQKV